MTLLSAAELASIQSLAESGMAGTATILTQTTVETVDGQESVWATVGFDVPVWVYQATAVSGTIGALAGGVAISQTFSVRVPVGTAVESGDHLIVDGVTYIVESTSQSSTYRPWLECGCRVLV